MNDDDQYNEDPVRGKLHLRFAYRTVYTLQSFLGQPASSIAIAEGWEGDGPRPGQPERITFRGQNTDNRLIDAKRASSRNH